MIVLKRLGALACVLATAAMGSCTSAGTNRAGDWRSYEANDEANHFSALTQINRSNVARLERVWQYATEGSAYTNPIVIGGVMYVMGSKGAIVALDAATGQQIWQSEPGLAQPTLRGLAYWQSKDGKDRRILFTNAKSQLLEIDAATGRQIMTFGDDGAVDLRVGLGRPIDSIGRIASMTPGRVFENLIIMGSSTGEGYGAPPGHIRAYDVRTGKMAWIFHTIPQEGEYGAGQWAPEARKNAAAVNMWGGMAIDAKRGIAYIPLGSAAYDFWGVDRPGSNLYANSLVALDARTGKRLWHFQTVHHDLWDYDLATTPTLMTVKHKGKDIDIVVQAGKTGFLYVFDRVTGKPLWPIEERPVPASDVPGEVASPTQPFPTVVPPFSKQTFSVEDVDTRLSPDEYQELRNRIAAARNDGIFTPPTIDRESVEMPGNNGGSNWGASGADPRLGLYYVIGYNSPTLLKLEKREPKRSAKAAGATPIERGRAIYRDTCSACHGDDRGGGPVAPDLRQVAARLTPAQVRDVIFQGRGHMPAFGDVLSKDDIDALVAMLTGALPEKGANEIPTYAAAPENDGRGAKPATGDRTLRYYSGYGFFTTKRGTPGVKPPWSQLSAYDMNTGRQLWQIPIGKNPAYGFDVLTGADASKTGMVVTAGGLIFIPSVDRKLHAYDSSTGCELWTGSLPARPWGIPASYSVDGRQFIVVPVGGGFFPAKQGDKPGYVAFALPE